MSNNEKNLDINFEDILSAYNNISKIVHKTPIKTSRTFNKLIGHEVYFKCENLQKAGAFKFRGAYNCISKLLSEKKINKEKGVIAYSSGNHAQAVAYVSKILDIPATICMPKDAPSSKVEATKDYGAKVVFYDRYKESRAKVTEQIAAETNTTMIPPFEHPYIIAGQGTAAYELLKDVSDLDLLLVPVSGGGLLAGCSIAAKNLKPEIKIYGIEPEDANDWQLSIQRNERVEIEAPSTIADGLRNTSPGEIPFPIVQENVDDILLVSEEKIKEALRFLLFRMKTLTEPSGAVTTAALLETQNLKKLQENFAPDQKLKIGVIISGGNIDPETLTNII